MNKLRTHICNSRILFVIFYPKDCSQVRGSGSTMFYDAFTSGSSNSQILPSSLPLLASFFNVLPLPQKFNRFHRFRFHIPASNYDKFVLQSTNSSQLSTTFDLADTWQISNCGNATKSILNTFEISIGYLNNDLALFLPTTGTTYASIKRKPVFAEFKVFLASCSITQANQKKTLAL